MAFLDAGRDLGADPSVLTGWLSRFFYFKTMMEEGEEVMKNRWDIKLPGIAFLLAVCLLTGCGRRTGQEDAPAANTDMQGKEPAVAGEVSDDAQERQIQRSPESDTVEGKDTTEDEDGYEELMAKYAGTPYEKWQWLQCIPRKGQVLTYRFTDTVESIEELGSLSPTMEPTISVVHFKDETNDYCVEENKAAQKLIDSAEWEKQEKYRDRYACTQIWGIGSIPIPEVGTTGDFSMDAIVRTVTDTGVEKDGNRFYEVEDGHGLKNLLAVPIDRLLPDEYEPYEIGTYEGKTYLNPAYGVRIGLGGTEIQEENLAQVSFSMNGMATRWTELIPISSEASGFPFLNIGTYEFTLEVTDEIMDRFKAEELGGAEIQEADDIGDSSYERAVIVDEYGRETAVWYRVEKNRIYTICAYLASGGSPETVLELLQAY